LSNIYPIRPQTLSFGRRKKGTGLVRRAGRAVLRALHDSRRHAARTIIDDYLRLPGNAYTRTGFVADDGERR
jgi:hypothetical protein